MKKQTGFTLVELLISISIIAILSVVLVISFSNAQKSSRDQRRISDLKAIQNAAEQYYMLKGSYPTSAGSWSVNSQTVLQKFPTDPKGGAYMIDTGAFNGGLGYCFCALMENDKNSNASWVSSGSYCDWSNTDGYFCIKNQQ